MVKLDLSEYLRPEDIKNEEVITFLDEGTKKSVEETGFDNEVFDIKIELENKENKIWTMNKTSQRAIGAVYGDETKNWVGKQAKLEKMKQMVAGKEKMVVYGKPIEEVVKDEQKR